MADDTKITSVSDVLRTNKMGTPSEAVDKVFQATPVGPLSTAIGDSFYGINHRQTPNAIQINKDMFGLTFFTRPLMNLTSDNLRPMRKLAPLLTNEPASVQRIIRCLLDKRLADSGINSPFVDNQQAFIPILTNNLLSMSGWPDVNAPTFTSQEGVYKEAFSFIDGVTDNYGTYDITANFRNIPGDPITLLFYVWLMYGSYVFQGEMVPYPEYLIQNEIDYMTRIYRLVLDNTKTYVKAIGCCGAAFPVSAPLGAKFNFEADRPFNSSMSDQISIPFRMIGACYQDDILIDEFNRTTQFFNGTLADGKRQQFYVQVPKEALVVFNNRGYPRINPNTYELEWWVPKDEYNYRLPTLQQLKQNGT
jgi:hypothetical protein